MGLIIRLPIMTNKPNIQDEDLNIFTIEKGQFIAEESQSTFDITHGFTEKDSLEIHINNLYLERDINYSVSINGKTINVPTLSKGDIVSWRLFKFKNKKSICGEMLCGELNCGDGLDKIIN